MPNVRFSRARNERRLEAIGMCRIWIRSFSAPRDLEFAIRAYIDNAFLFCFGGNLMHRVSVRPEIAARLQGFDVGSQVLRLTRDHHGTEVCALAMYLSLESSLKLDKSPVRMAIPQVAP